MGRTVLHVQPDSASRASSSRSREFSLPPALSSSGSSAAGSVWTDILSLLLIFAAAGSGLLLLSKSVPVLQAQCPPSTSLEAAASAINASCEVTAEPTAISLPNSLEDVKALYNLLHRYTAHHFTWLVGAFAYVYVFKQAFSIPGSAFLNCLAGALFGLGFGFPFVCCLTAAGTSCCYWMSYFFGRRLADRAFADRISELRVTLTDHKERGNLLPFLLFIRLFPMSPNFLLNMASPLLGVPYHYFLISVFFGLMPYNFICVHAGTVLGHLRSWDDVLNPRVLLELASVAVLVLAFSAVTKRFQHRGAVSAPSKAAKPSSPPSIEPAERKRRVSENGAEALRARRPVPADSRGTQAAR